MTYMRRLLRWFRRHRPRPVQEPGRDIPYSLPTDPRTDELLEEGR